MVFQHHNAPHALKKHCHLHLVVARQQSRWDIDSKRTCSLQVQVNSNLVDCKPGKLAGLVPLRILPV